MFRNPIIATFAAALALLIALTGMADAAVPKHCAQHGQAHRSTLACVPSGSQMQALASSIGTYSGAARQPAAFANAALSRCRTSRASVSVTRSRTHASTAIWCCRTR